MRDLFCRFSVFWLLLISIPTAQAGEPIFTKLRTVGLNELNTILTTERDNFIKETSPSYELPTYQPAKYKVDIYKVQYSSVIPEKAKQPITAYGLIAIPKGTGAHSLPIVSYQHGTVFGQYEVPSYAFIKNNPQYEGSYETRLMVAQFASQGYIVIAADYFGLGDSIEPEAFTVKSSHQQACLDLYLAALNLLNQLGLTQTELFLAGWSQGGLVTMDFLERLEKETTISIKAASTAAAPCDTFAALNGFIYNPREIDAKWLNTIIIFTAFSYENYYGTPAERLIRAEYLQNSRRLYERDYSNAQEFEQIFNTLPTDLKILIKPEYADPNYFAASGYGRDLQRVEAYRWLIQTPVRMYYGTIDEVITIPVGKLPAFYQTTMGNQNKVIALPVNAAHHRGTFLTAVAKQKDWFDRLISSTGSASE